MKLVSLKRYLPIIGVALFIYILLKIDVGLVFAEMMLIDIPLFLLAIALTGVMFLLQTFKWFIIARRQAMPLSFFEAVRINLISNFYGFVTPSKIGGVVRAEYLKKYAQGELGKGLFNFTIDKVLDISSVIFAAILFSFVFKDKLDLPLSFFIITFFVFVFFTFFFIDKQRSKWALRFIYRRMSHRFKDKMKTTFESFYEDIPKKRYFVWFFFWNLVSWFAIYYIFYIVGIALGIDLGLVYYLAILPLGTLVSILPISISGLGTREAALIALFGLFGVAAVKVFSLSIITLIIVGIIPSIIGIFLVINEKK